MSDVLQRFDSGQPKNTESLRLLEQLRKELRRTYPKIRITRLLLLLIFSGRKSFPAGFHLRGSIFDLGPRGAIYGLLSLKYSSSGFPKKDSSLFNTSFYKNAYTDLRNADIKAWQHYQVFGRLEGRTPHPLVNVTFLQSANPETPVGNLLDLYLEDKSRWFTRPSPYVDTSAYAVSGNWNNSINPLIDLLDKGLLRVPFYNDRLLTIDSDVLNIDNEQFTAVSTLIAINGFTRSEAVINAYEIVTEDQLVSNLFEDIDAEFIPSFALCVNGKAFIYPEISKISADESSVVTSKYVFSIKKQKRIFAGVFHWFDQSISNETALQLISQAHNDDVIATNTTYEFDFFTYMLRKVNKSEVKVLEPTHQHVITCKEIRRYPSSNKLEFDCKPLPAHFFFDGSIILFEAPPQSLQEIDLIERLRNKGAKTYVLNNESFLMHLSVLDRGKAIIANKKLLSEISFVLPRDKIFAFTWKDLGMDQLK